MYPFRSFLQAPGLQQLVKALSDADFVDIYVSAPDGERSAQSSKITLGRGLTVRPWSVPGASLAYASDGSPADSAMIALNRWPAQSSSLAPQQPLCQCQECHLHCS